MTPEEQATALEQARAMMRRGAVNEALEAARGLISSNANDVGALNLLASIYGRTGRPELAIPVCRQVLQLDSSSVSARSNLAAALRATGAQQDAIPVAAELIRIAPNEPRGYLNLGLAQSAVGEHGAAAQNLLRAIRLQPKLPLGHMALGDSFYRLRKLRDAARAYENVLSLEPRNYRALHALAKLRIELGETVEAAAIVERFKALMVSESTPALDQVKTLQELGEHESAEYLLREHVESHPEDAEALVLLGLRLQQSGRFTEARQPLRRACDIQPSHGTAYWALVQGNRLSNADEELIGEMEAALAGNSTAANHRMYLHYALGKAYDDLKQFERAMGHFDEANRLAEERIPDRAKFNADIARAQFDDTIRFYSRKFFDRWSEIANPSAKPIFIVGMMRSGTTLVEQIVSGHSNVRGAGELDFWSSNSRLAVDVQGGGIRKEEAANLAADYLGLLDRMAPDLPYVTDKKPQNYLHLGLIHKLFPNAKIVHCRRNPADTCLSIYMNAFNVAPAYAHRREHLAEAYRGYERLMGHWRELISPKGMYDLDYEDLVENRETETRRLLEFLGLEWEGGCLHPERNERSVSTASLWQVRQPVYRTSVARWRNYEPWLGALRGLLTISAD